jgi:hypothetical protein
METQGKTILEFRSKKKKKVDLLNDAFEYVNIC